MNVPEMALHARSRYVVGFMFSSDLQKIVLIEKQKPEWQKGFLNGVGGSIEFEENVYDAMVREFFEETGVSTRKIDWWNFCIVYDEKKDISLYLFRCHYHSDFHKVKSMEFEKIDIYDCSDLLTLKTVPNLKTFIPMAANKAFFNAHILAELR